MIPSLRELLLQIKAVYSSYGISLLIHFHYLPVFFPYPATGVIKPSYCSCSLFHRAPEPLRRNLKAGGALQHGAGRPAHHSTGESTSEDVALESIRLPTDKGLDQSFPLYSFCGDVRQNGSELLNGDFRLLPVEMNGVAREQTLRFRPTIRLSRSRPNP